MSTLLSLVCLAAILVSLDFKLRLYRLLFGTKRSVEYSERLVAQAARLCLVTVKAISGARFDFEPHKPGPMPDRFLIVANHQSIADLPDIVYFFRGRKFRFIAKQELGQFVPFMSIVLKLQKNCLVARHSNVAQSMKALEVFTKHIRNLEVCPILFPEGTRTRDGAVHTFHTAGFRKLIEAAPMPVAVVALDGGSEVATVKKLFTGLSSVRYRTKLLAVLPTPTGKREILETLDTAHAMITAQIEEWHAEKG